jgi:hypothetical protein
LSPGASFRPVGLDQVPDGYRDMNEREALKVTVNPQCNNRGVRFGSLRAIGALVGN